jgi:hypothetical protein
MHKKTDQSRRPKAAFRRVMALWGRTSVPFFRT